MSALVLVLALFLGLPSTTAESPRGPQPAYAKGGQEKDTDKPQRQPKRLLPSQFAAATKPRLLTGSRRPQIVLRVGRLDLMTGPDVEWSARVDQRTPVLGDLYRLVRRSPHPQWLTQPRPGLFVLRAAIVQAPGTRLIIATPRVRELRMISTRKRGQEVYLSGVAAKVAINGTWVTSWRPGGGPDRRPSLRRPFVSYDQAGSVLNTTAARYSFLGGDSILAYGVTWGRGATGAAMSSTFDHNFFGAYSNAAVGVLFLRNVFRDNDLYGLDPHSGSRRLKVLDNSAFDNGSHGIIFSFDVVDSVVIGNRSYRNRVNGIMMDERSDRNLITGNRTWGNAGDGIVVQNSSDTTVRANVVTGNRVGLRVTGDSLRTRADGNHLIGNRRGVEVCVGPAPARALTGPTRLTRNVIVGDRTGDGIAVKDFAGVQIVGNSVTRYVNGVLLSGRSARAQVTDNHLAGQVRGIEVDPAVTRAVLGRNLVESASERGLVLAGPGTVSTDDVVTGSEIAVDVRGDVTVSGVRVRDGRRGINLFSGTATVSAADVTVREYGVNVEPAAALTLRHSTIVADHPVVGVTVPVTDGNQLELPPPPFKWLALAGVLFILVAVFLHLVSRRRAPAHHARHTAVPSGVGNAW